MAIKILKPEERGLMENKVFKGQTLFSNGVDNTYRLDAFGYVYVFNDDILYPNSFLGMHPHQNVEIVTIMISGTESHKDTLGIHENYEAGDVQLISSGKGLYHEGGNVSNTETARHLQIWIAPKKLNLEPKVSIKKIEHSKNSFSLLVSPNGIQESLIINQEVWIFIGNLNLNQKESYKVQSLGNGVMIYLIYGELEIKNQLVKEGTTIFLTDEDSIELVSKNSNSSFILIDTEI